LKILGLDANQCILWKPDPLNRRSGFLQDTASFEFDVLDAATGAQSD